MLVIQQVERNSSYLSMLYQWFESEWGEVEPLSQTLNGFYVPKPIIALQPSQLHIKQLAGGLVFSRFLSPITKEQAIWINAVFIQSEFRKQGIASRLIQYVEQKIKELGISELFVFTHIPQLYLNLGWAVIETTCDEYFVLVSSHL